jgi:hypothetical protein
VTAVLFVRPIRYFFCALLRQMAEKSLKELIATKLKLKSVEEELKQVLRPSTHTTVALTTTLCKGSRQITQRRREERPKDP